VLLSGLHQTRRILRCRPHHGPRLRWPHPSRQHQVLVPKTPLAQDFLDRTRRLVRPTARRWHRRVAQSDRPPLHQTARQSTLVPALGHHHTTAWRRQPNTTGCHRHGRGHGYRHRVHHARAEHAATEIYPRPTSRLPPTRPTQTPPTSHRRRPEPVRGRLMRLPTLDGYLGGTLGVQVVRNVLPYLAATRAGLSQPTSWNARRPQGALLIRSGPPTGPWSYPNSAAPRRLRCGPSSHRASRIRESCEAGTGHGSQTTNGITRSAALR